MSFTKAGEVVYGCHEPGHYEAGTVGRSRCNNAFPGYLSGRGMTTRRPLVVAPAGASGGLVDG